MKKKGLVKTIIIAIVAAVIILSLIGSIISKLLAGNKLPQVTTVKVGQEDLQTYVDGSGIVESRKVKTYFSPVNAKVNSVDFNLGDVVDGNAHVIGFDLTNLEKNNQKAMLSARASSLSASDAIEKANQADSKVAEAALELSWYEKAVEEQQAYVNELLRYQEKESQTEIPKIDQALVNKLLEEIGTKEIDLTGKKAELENVVATKEKLSYELELAKSQNDAAKIATVVADQASAVDKEVSLKQSIMTLEADLSSLKTQLTAAQSVEVPTPGKPSVETTIALNEAQAELAELQGELKSREAIVENGSPAMTSAGREQLQVDSNLRDLEAKDIQALIAEGKKGIHTDFKGIISDLKVVNGMDVVQGQELFTVTGLDDIIVKININKSDLAKIKVGQEADITIAGNAYKGKVDAISKIAVKNEKGGTLIPVTLTITNPDENIFIGVDAKVKVIGQKVDQAFAIPSEALNISKEGSFVYLLKNGEIVKQNVEVGMATNTKVEIKSGLSLGDEVVTDLNGLEEGAKAESKMPELEDKTMMEDKK